METLEFALIVMACVIVSAIVGKIVTRVALPLIQILVGLVVALFAPAVTDVHLSSELLMVLFIAPLLFNEARESNRRELYRNKGQILSLAVGLVVATVLVVGAALYGLVPSMPLAAAFACAAALGPTDAAAVGAMGSTVGLNRRQRLLLSGESLINDASGVVAFQFAVAAALTGSFSAVEAGGEFLLLFFGGIAVGLAVGGAVLFAMLVLRHFGYEDTTLHVLFEVLTPFVVYLLAEGLHVSGILAVVAAGLVLAGRAPRLISADAARRQMVSNTFWEIIVFLINGIVFTMLGMELPLAVDPSILARFSMPELFGAVLLITLLLYLCRFIWVLVMSLMRFSRLFRRKGKRHITPMAAAKATHDAAVITLGGAKGVVTLSIIFTLPLAMPDGSPFPDRSLIILLTAAVILCTLLCANFLLPLLAPKQLSSNEDAVHRATIQVLERTIQELRGRLDTTGATEYVPALRLTIMRYETRLNRERRNSKACREALTSLQDKILVLQQQRADYLQNSQPSKLSVTQIAPYYWALRGIRSSLGYEGEAVKVGARFRSFRGMLHLAANQIQPNPVPDEQFEQIYYDTCLFAIDLEHVALSYLRDVEEAHDERETAAKLLIDSHEAALTSLWGRINYDQDFSQVSETVDVRVHTRLPQGMKANFLEQFAKARHYADEVDENALTVELEVIRHMSEAGEIADSVARELRSHVYALQASLENQ